MLFGRDAELVEERVVLDLLHVVPVHHDPMFDWVFKHEDAAFGLRFVATMAVSS